MSDTQPQPQPVTFKMPVEEPLWAAGDNIGLGSKVMVDFVAQRAGDVLKLHKAVALSERQLAELEDGDDYLAYADSSPESEYLPDPGDADPDAELLRVQTCCEVQGDSSVRPLYGFASRELSEDEGSAFLAEQEAEREAKRKADPAYRKIEEEIYGSDKTLSYVEREYFSADDRRRWWWNSATVEERRAAVAKFRERFPKPEPPLPPKYKTAEQKRREQMERERERAARIASEREVSRIMRSAFRSMSPGQIRAWAANITK